MTDPAPEPDLPDPPKEGLDFRPDGTIHLWIDGTRYPLRRPRGREFRQLRELLQDKVDEINLRLVPQGEALQAKLLAAVAARVAAGEGAALTEDEAREDRDEGRRINLEREQVGASWWTEMLAVLGDGRTIEHEDIPPWMLDTDDVFVLIEHWRTLPSLSGGR